MLMSDGSERDAADEPEFHRFLREANGRSTQIEIDRLRWENYRLRARVAGEVATTVADAREAETRTLRSRAACR